MYGVFILIRVLHLIVAVRKICIIIHLHSVTDSIFYQQCLENFADSEECTFKMPCFIYRPSRPSDTLQYVSRKAAGKGRAVLEGVGLDSETIAACYNSHPLNEEEAVQAGLTKWCGGRGKKPPTWQVVFAAMEYAQIAEQHVHNLKNESGLFGTQCVTGVCVHVCMHTVQVSTSCTYNFMCSGSASVWSVMQWTKLATS